MRLVGRLDHPNIVRALDAERDRPRPLHRHGVHRRAQTSNAPAANAGRCPRGSRPTTRARPHWGWPTPTSRGIVHRDIKPSNLLLSEDGRVKVLDLGLGMLMEADDVDQGSFATGDGMAVGTVDYMSPEQAIGREELDGRSDLYSLGCAMYHLLTGQVPFPGEAGSSAWRAGSRAARAVADCGPACRRAWSRSWSG